MEHNWYGVKDQKASCFLYLHEATNHKTAIRSFGDGVRNPKSVISQHPEDYALYFLGTFDDVAGRWKNEITPQFLSDATEFSNLKQAEVLSESIDR